MSMKWNKEEAAIRAALSQVKTPEWAGMEEAVFQGKASSSPRRSLPRTALIAAALATLLAVAAVAAVPGLWERFFPNPVPQNAVTSLGVSQTSGDYTLTLADTVADDNGLILLLALSRADGGDIHPEANLQSKSMAVKLLVDGVPFSGGGGFDERILLEDGKTIYFSYEVQDRRTDGQRLAGKALTFTAQGVAIPIYSPDSFGYEPEGAVDLSPLGAVDIPDLSHLKDWEREDDTRTQIYEAASGGAISLPLPLEEFFPENRVRGAVLLEEGLAIALTSGEGRRGDYISTGIGAVALVDTRDGTSYRWSQGNGYTTPDGEHRMLYSFRDCPLTGEDLPYLELEVYYDIDQILSEKSFALDFTADSGAALIVPLEETVTLGDTTLHPFELRLSALGVSLSFRDISDTAFDAIRPTGEVPLITLKDGSVVPAVWQGGYGAPDKTCSVAFRLETEEGQRIFLDTAQVASVAFGGKTLWTAPD